MRKRQPAVNGFPCRTEMDTPLVHESICYNSPPTRRMMKKFRQKAILDLVRSREIASQEELLENLLARKIDVSQSTLSRDIQELGLAKSGGVYTVMDTDAAPVSDESVRRLLGDFLLEVAVAQNILVLKT